MECNDGANERSALKVAAMLSVGLVFVLIIVALAYFTAETAIGGTYSCTLWTDIPGRLAIFIICYYIAGACGFLPIPDCFLLKCLPVPLKLWRFETWGDICRNLWNFCLINRPHFSEQDDYRFPLLQEQPEEQASEQNVSGLPPVQGQYKIAPPREQGVELPGVGRQLEQNFPIPSTSRSIPIPINTTNRTGAIPKQFGHAKCEHRNEYRSDESLSFDSPRGGHIVPMVKGKSSKLSDTCSSSQETTNEQTEAMGGQKEKPDTPPRTADTDYQLPDYPRFPWVCLRHPGGLPPIARRIHAQNLKFEKREIERYERTQNQQTRCVENKAESSNEVRLEVAGNDNSAINRRTRPLSRRSPNRSSRHVVAVSTSTTPLRRRSRSMAENLEYRKPKLHSRIHSEKSRQNTSPPAGPSGISKPARNSDEAKQEEEMAKCCESSPNLHLKVERIKKAFAKTKENTEKVKSAGASSTQAELPEKPDVKITINSEDSGSNSDEAQN